MKALDFLKYIVSVAFLLTAWALGGVAEANNFVVLKSSSLASYNDAVVAFRTNCAGDFAEYDMNLDEDKGKAFAERINRDKPDLVFAVGRHAARVARQHVDPSIPVLFAMVNNHQRDDLKTNNITGVALEIPVEVQLMALKSLVPRARRIGVIFNPRNSRELLENAMEVAEKHNLEIVASRVAQPEDTPRALRAFADGIDAFWLIPDSTVVTPTAFRAILEYSQRDNVPFVAFNEAFVRAGALLSLGPNASSIGAQSCQLAQRIIGGESPRGIDVAAPQGLELFLNMKTSEQLGLSTIAANAMGFSARQGVRINVVQ